jgi:excisionase family DNA binding protein
MLDAKQVGALLGCSWRHVLRMADRGLMPWGVKLGALRRWDADELEQWIANGCTPCRPTKGA